MFSRQQRAGRCEDVTVAAKLDGDVHDDHDDHHIDHRVLHQGDQGRCAEAARVGIEGEDQERD